MNKKETVFGDQELIEKIKKYMKPILIEKEDLVHICPHCENRIHLDIKYKKYTTHEYEECECCGQSIDGELVIDEYKLPFTIKCECGIRAVISYENEDNDELQIKWLSKYQDV